MARSLACEKIAARQCLRRMPQGEKLQLNTKLDGHMKDLPIRKRRNATERVGVNYVRAVVEGANSIFHEIHHENDYGNDAFIELVDNEVVTGEMIALQVKSGVSYCDRSKCWIPVSLRQWNYWSKNRLPVVGVVYDPSEKTGYWIEIGRRIRASARTSRIVFEKTEVSRFDKGTFEELFVPLFLRRTIKMPFAKSLRFAESATPEMHSLGVRSLMHAHRNDPRTWEAFERILCERPAEMTDPILPYFLAHIPGHGDIFWHRDNVISDEVSEAVSRSMNSWDDRQIVPLLRLVDENGFERGSVGQSVYAVIDQAVGTPSKKLKTIAQNPAMEPTVREAGLMLICMIEQEKAEAFLRTLADDGKIGRLAAELLGQLREHGYFATS